MKILIIKGTNPFVQSNAQSNRFLSLIDGLSNYNLKIKLLFVNGFSGKSEKKKFKISGNYKSINYEYLYIIDYSNFLVRQIFNRVLPTHIIAKKILKFIQADKYDYVWIVMDSKIINISLNLFRKNLNVKFIHERSEFSWIGFLGNEKLHSKYLNLFLPNIDIFPVMTQTLIDYYNKYVGSKTKIFHLPMTVDLSRFSKKTVIINTKDHYIGYCGSMSNSKDGVIILIQSFIKIMDSYPDLNLYLAGPLRPEKDYLLQKKLISNNNAQERIKYVGLLSKEEMPGFLMGADLLALARPKSKQAEGGFPTKLGEYLATGNPVCVTNIGEIGNYLKDNESAYIAEPDSVDSFVSVLKRALTDKNAHKIGLAGQKVAFENFNKDIQTKRLYEFLVQNCN
jgi:glycosyltransferase involved in cell wall biosynthesis